MSLQAICQRCGERQSDWTVTTAAFDVREIRNWKVQLCELCAVQIEMVVRAALASPAVLTSVTEAESL